MNKYFLNSVVLFILVFFSADSQAQNNGTSSSMKSELEIIQFHSEHRCVTCLKIEGLSKDVAKSSNIPFKLINVDDTKNSKMAEKFEAAGTAVFLYNSKTGKKKDLTDFAFMNARNKDKFIRGLKQEIAQF